LVRGALWTGLALTIVRMTQTRRSEASLAVASTFAVLLALPIGLFPNPYMPPLVRQAHFFEILSSMSVFGGIAGWVMTSKGWVMTSKSRVMTR
jgi:threonine/homoserine efflux transporter RhtA